MSPALEELMRLVNTGEVSILEFHRLTQELDQRVVPDAPTESSSDLMVWLFRWFGSDVQLSEFVRLWKGGRVSLDIVAELLPRLWMSPNILVRAKQESTYDPLFGCRDVWNAVVAEHGPIRLGDADQADDMPKPLNGTVVYRAAEQPTAGSWSTHREPAQWYADMKEESGILASCPIWRGTLNANTLLAWGNCRGEHEVVLSDVPTDARIDRQTSLKS